VKTDVDVVVVGAGLAGLTAARDLEAAGATVMVVEARDRVGGRTLNHPLSNGEMVEIGGEWAGPGQDRLLALSSSLGVDTFPTYDTGRSVLDYRGRVRTFGKFSPPRIPPHAMIDFVVTQLRLDRLARRVPLDAPWSAPGARRWDGETVESWLRRAMHTKGGRDLMDLSITAVLAAEPADLSLLHLLFYRQAAGGSRPLMTAQKWRFVGGSQEVSIRLARTLSGDVALSSPVWALVQDDEGVTVRTDDRDIRAGRVVVTLPPALAGRIRYQPAMPADRDQLTQSAPMGSSIKTLVSYARPFWRDKGLNGQAGSTTGPVRATFDNTLPAGGPGVIAALVEAGEARRLRRLDPDERRTEVLGCLVRFFGPEAGRPAAYAEHDWSSDEWSRGCYGAYFPPGTWTNYGPALRRPVGRVHWAGSETSPRWAGYMEGAVRSGERAAAEVMAELDSPSRVGVAAR
jgi:monoamine oxidase